MSTRKQIQFVDDQGKPVTGITSVTVWDVDTSTASTITADIEGATSVTNPMTTTSAKSLLFAAGGNVVWCSDADLHDISVVVGSNVLDFYDVGGTLTTLTIPRIVSAGKMGMDSSDYYIWVSPSGSDGVRGNGSFSTPYLTITKALASATTTRKTILAMPGEYVESAELTWPNITGIVLAAPLGDVVISSSYAASTVFYITPTYTATTFEATLSGIEISGESGNKGIMINNANVTKKLNVYLNNCTFSGEAQDASIAVAHGSADNAIRVYVNGSGETWEGIATFVCANTGDRLRIKNQILLGGLTTTGNVAGEVFLQNTGILTGAITIDNDHKLSTVGCWYQTDADPTVYTVCADAFATYQ